MATSGSKSVAVTSHDTLKFTWTLASQSVDDNTSTVSWKMQLITDDVGKIISSNEKEWSVTINGKKYSGTNKIGIDNNSTKTLASGVTVIEHNADGTKTFSYSFKQEIAITFAGSYVGTKSGSGSGTLETIIPRSTVAADNGTLGVAQVLTVTRKTQNLTHTITYTCGEASDVICEKSSEETIDFTPDIELAKQNATGTSVLIVFTVETFSNEKSAGTTTKTISCAIPDSVKPVVAIDVSDPTEYNATYGSYIQNVSKFRINASAEKVYGAEIVAYKITADGKNYSDSAVTTDVIAGSGSLEIIAEATDSRGRIGTTSVTVEVAEYSSPKITALTVKRCDELGSSRSNGEYLAVKFSSEVSPIGNKNTATYSLQYKKTSDAAYTEVPLDDYANQYTVESGIFIFAAETFATYDVVLTVSDAFNGTPRGATGASVSKLFSILKRGLGFAFGKVAELENVFDVAFRTRHLGGFLYPELSTGSDLDAQTTPNRYVLKKSNEYVNAPFAEVDAILDIIGTADETFVQRFTLLSKTDPRTYERMYDSEGWSAWADENAPIIADIDSHSTTLEAIQAEIEKVRVDMLLAAYPVGSIYISVNSKDPAYIFGGVWVQIEDRFLLAAGYDYTAGDTNGAAEYEMSVTHSHTAPVGYSSAAVGGFNLNGTASAGKGKGYKTSAIDYEGTLDANITAYKTGNATVTATIPTMPPYLVVYVWKRTK